MKKRRIFFFLFSYMLCQCQMIFFSCRVFMCKYKKEKASILLTLRRARSCVKMSTHTYIASTQHKMPDRICIGINRDYIFSVFISESYW